MPFDPNLPQENTLADAAQVRAQFNGLADLIADRVTTAELQAEIYANTAASFAGIAKLNLTVSDPPTQAQMQSIADKIDELITAGQR